MKKKMYKGCTNEACVANQNKRKYKKDEAFCNLCGEPLKHVCASKSCYKFIESDEKYCLCCEAQKKQFRDNVVDGAKKIGGAIVTAAPFVVGVVSKIGPRKK